MRRWILGRWSVDSTAPSSVFWLGSAPLCSPGLGPAARAETDLSQNPRRHPRSNQLTTVLALALCACSKPPEAEKPAEPALDAGPAAAEQARKSAPQLLLDAASSAIADASLESGADAGGWVREARENDVPLCVFASYQERDKAKFIEQVRKQTLRANSELIFGAFAPRCINEACDARATLQCWVDLEADNTLVVQSRFLVEHKLGSSCKQGCETVTAGCPTPELAPGKYTVRYGDRTHTLRVPSTLQKPCLTQK